MGDIQGDIRRLKTVTPASTDLIPFLDASNDYAPSKATIANILAGGVGLDATELGYLDGVVAGTAAANKALVLNGSKGISTITSADITTVNSTTVNTTTANAGSSGTAGTLNVFPATAAKGKTAFTTADNTGDTTTTINIALQATTRTYTVPDAGTNASFTMTEGAQTINGAQTYGAINRLKATNAITAFATGGQASATALTSSINSITTCATAADSVKLPTSVAGMMVQVSNLGAAYANVFPVTGELIDSLSANTAVSLAVGESIIFTCAVAGSWKSTPMRGVGAKYTTGTTTTTFTAGQLTGALNVFYNNTQGTPGSIATRTATEMFVDDPYARVGGTYRLRIINNQGTGTLTVTAGTGVTLTGTMTIAANTFRDFVVTYTSATALTIQTAGIGTDT